MHEKRLHALHICQLPIAIAIHTMLQPFCSVRAPRPTRWQAGHQGRQRTIAHGSAGRALHVVRHGPSDINAYFALHRYGSPHQEPMRDPMMFDARLTRDGQGKAKALAEQVSALTPRPDAVLVSPLSRCLETAVLAFGHLGVPLQAEPLLRERVLLSSEVGRPVRALKEDFPSVSFPAAIQEEWWYPQREGHKHAAGQAGDITEEPEDVYEARLGELRRLLAGRPEACLALVSHWGVLNALTAADLQPGQLLTVTLPDAPALR